MYHMHVHAVYMLLKRIEPNNNCARQTQNQPLLLLGHHTSVKKSRVAAVHIYKAGRMQYVDMLHWWCVLIRAADSIPACVRAPILPTNLPTANYHYHGVLVRRAC